jgi:hypothetical protein
MASACFVGASLACMSARADPQRDLAACSAAFSAAPDLAKGGKLLAARDQLTLCAADKCPASMRPLCADDLRRIQDRIPTVVFAARGARGEDLLDVRVTENGKVLTSKLDGRAVELDPGEHVFHFEGARGASTDQTVVVREGEQARAVAVTLADAAPPMATATTAPAESPVATTRPVPWTVYLSGAVTVVAAGSFAVFGTLGLTERSNLNGCKGSCDSGKVSQVTTSFTVADASWITGLVALAVTGVLYFTRPTVGVTASRGDGVLLGVRF